MRVPDGWNTLPISEILERVSDPVFPELEKNYYQIGIRSHGKGLFYKEAVTGAALGNKRVFRIHPDCFIVNIVFAWEQAVAKTSANEIGMIASHRFPMFRPRNHQCDIDYLTYFFKTPKGKYLLELASPGGAGRNKTLGQNEFSLLKLTLPPINEQQKISQILSTWDKAIDKLEALIAAKQKRKKALMEQLLTGNTRLTKNNIDWKFGSFDDLFMVKNDKKTQVKSSDYLKSGVTPIIDQGQMTIAGFTNNETIYSDVPVIIFGDHTRIIKWIDYKFASGADGTQVLKTKKPLDLKFGFFLLSNVNLPSLGYSRHMKTLKEKEFKYPIDIKEQQKIASILTTADNEIVIHQNQLAALKQQKTGLMQQLLTGKVRVTV